MPRGRLRVDEAVLDFNRLLERPDRIIGSAFASGDLEGSDRLLMIEGIGQAQSLIEITLSPGRFGADFVVVFSDPAILLIA